jgi:hypothetical protein
VIGQAGVVDNAGRSFQELALVDVDMFVSSGAPRAAFQQLDHRRWRMDVDMLRAAGWTIHASGSAVGLPIDDPRWLTHAHAWDLGPAWAGGQTWTATFSLPDVAVAIEAWVQPEWSLPDPQAIGRALPSRSPWCWRIHGLPAGRRAGRAELPIFAAAEVERIVLDAGAAPFERTRTQRDLT